MIKSNFHTHTTYCDGKHSAEEMVLSAIEKGMHALGFSTHSYTSRDLTYCIRKEKVEEYKNEINALKEKYKDKIRIYLGSELDVISDMDRDGFDYFLSAVHYIDIDGQLLTVDGSGAEQKADAEKYFGGDMLSYAEAYYEMTKKLADMKEIGFIAHLDTSEDAKGENITPNIINNYNGQQITLNTSNVLSPDEYPDLNNHVGKTLITTDGTTLLGADDKAGIAIIMSTIEKIIQNNTNYPNIFICFTPDEEIGRGTEAFNYNYYADKKCKYAYTLDGGEPNVINFENFNAATCVVTFTGKSIHPGSAKNKMINAGLVAMEFHELLPSNMVPSLTENYEGFNHLVEISGSVSSAKLVYIIRNHDLKIFNSQKELFVKASEYLNYKYGVCDSFSEDLKILLDKDFAVDLYKNL